MRNRWHIRTRADGAVILARRWPIRQDVGAETHLPGGDKLRLAHQIRQDVWRALQKVRGFSPIIIVADCMNGRHIWAGGQLDPACSAPANLALRLHEVLDDPERRARWVRWAQKGQRA